MITSMTGFGSSQQDIVPFGRVTVELRSSNHKFLETVLHLPEGFLSLEDKIKKEIETKIRRGRVTCAINITSTKAEAVCINEKLLRSYLIVLQNIKRRYALQGDLSIDALIHLPGVLSLAECDVQKEKIWPRLKVLLGKALNDLVRMREDEGATLQAYLDGRCGIMKQELAFIMKRQKDVCRQKVAQIETHDEQASFLKDVDIAEEVERLAFHIKNFSQKLKKSGPVGKELDFIAQEMQRETNTIGAKSCDSLLSAKVVHIKSQVEKIREQAQNIE